jgi:hypothetical protein
MADALDGLEETSFEFEGVRRRVFRPGSGPAVVVIHEVPGITPETSGGGSPRRASLRCCRTSSASRAGLFHPATQPVS